MPQETVKKIDTIDLETLGRVADALDELYGSSGKWDVDAMLTEQGRVHLARLAGQRSVADDIRGIINARRHRLKE